MKDESHLSSKPCPICDEKERKLLFRAPSLDAMSAEEFDIVRCSGCGLVSTLFEGSDEELGEFYGSMYYASPRSFFNYLKSAFIRALKVRKIEFHVPGGKILDIGCGDAAFLSALNSGRWEKYCMETGEVPGTGRKAIDTCITDYLSECGYPLEFFDVISLWASFEHVRTPSRMLHEIHGILKGSGLLFISVPNISSFQARAFREDWFALDPPRHLFHYDLNTITVLLERHGFEVFKAEKFSFEYGPFLFLQSMLNRMGSRYNSLYHTMKGARKLTPQILYDLSLSLAFGLHALLFSLFESLSEKGGGQIHVYAKKKI